MKTSGNDTQQIDDYLLRRMDEGEAVLFEARLVLEPGLHQKMHWQKKAHGFIRAYGRKQIKNELRGIEHQLFHHPAHDGFKQKIFRLFKR